MKNFISILLFVFLFAAGNAQDSLKLPGGYASFHLGAGPPFFDDGLMLLGADLSAGLQWSKWVGVGASFKIQEDAQYYSSGFTGISLQYRIRPVHWLAFRFDYGKIINHSTVGISLLKYVRDNYNFAHFYAGVKIGKYFSIGLSHTRLDKVKYKVCHDQVGSFDECTNISERYHKWNILGLLINVGITIN